MLENEHETLLNHFFLFAFNIFHNSCNDSLFFFRTSFSFWASYKIKISFDNCKFYFFLSKLCFRTAYEDEISFDNCRFYFFQSCASELRTKTRFLSTTAKLRALLDFVRRRDFFRSTIVNSIFFKAALLNFVRRRDFFQQQQSCARFWTLYKDEIFFDRQL
jgi:hypothetical protein